MSLFVWGSCVDGQLGLSGIDDDIVNVPRMLNDVESGDKRCVKEVSCGLSHTLLLLDCGSVFSCGSNVVNQLGREGPCRRFRQVKTLNKINVVQIACGACFNLCLSSKGEVYSWGSNDQGQLGREDLDDNSIRVIDFLNPHFVVHIVCGARHSMCLTRSSEIFAWGSNEDGQLGIGLKSTKSQPTPVQIVSLHSLSVRQLTCGGNFSFCLSVSGMLFSWGCNNSGQLGLGDTDSRDVPFPCASLKTVPVTRVCCGEAHTVMLTQDGGVFTCGAGDHGQLGHNNRNNLIMPTKVFEFMGDEIAHVVCGRKHTMALMTSTGQLMVFGNGSNGQLGQDNAVDLLIPKPIKGSWKSFNAETQRLSPRERNSNSFVIKKFYSGYGDCCYLVAEKLVTPVPRQESSNSIYPAMDVHIDHISYDDLTLVLNPQPGYKPDKELEILSRCLPVPACINASLLCKNHFNVTSRHHGVDLDTCHEFFTAISNFDEHSNIRVHVMNALLTVVESLNRKNFASAECLRIYLMIPQAFCLFQPDWILSIALPYCRALNLLDSAPRKYIEKWFSFIPLRYIRKCVDAFANSLKQCIKKVTPPEACAGQIPEPVNSPDILSILDVLKLLHLSNSARETSLGRDTFYINELPDLLNISAEYYHWIVRKHQQLCFPSLCDYPFIFGGVSKSLMLRMDAKIQMAKAVEKVHASNLYALFHRSFVVDLPEMIFKIRRNNILGDTVFNVERVNQFELKKPLKVIFENEEAQDEGGVRKEYFMLFFKELMNPNFAMFKYYEESRMLWFHEHTFEDPKRFALVGTMCGLSIYNSSLVDLNFPLALYKKLLSRPLCLDDLKELDSTLGRSLQSILDYEDTDFEDVFCLTFSIVNEVFGEQETINLKPDGVNIPVNLKNKTEYVDLYLDYVFNVSCKEQYKEFHDAFHMVFACEHESLLSLFEPIELQTLLVGNEQYDWSVLQRNTTYKDEYWSGHPVVCWFWQTFDEFSTREKKKFLMFLTGNDRVPIQGMTGIKLFIQPSEAGNDYLPVAHTCFNLLDLPKYSSKDRLSQKLRLAIEQSEGFGLV